MLTPEAQAVIEQRKREAQERYDGKRPLVDSRLGARTIGDMALVEPGCEIWAKTDLDDDPSNMRVWVDGEAKGGIVLEIVDSHPLGRMVDPETGEIQKRVRAFRCWDYMQPVHQAVTVLTEAQVDPSTFTAPSIVRIRNQYRRICKEIATRGSVAARQEIDLMLDAARMAAIVGAMTP